MTLRKSLQIRNEALKSCLRRRDAVMQGFTDAIAPITDPRVFGPVWVLINQHPPIPIPNMQTGERELVCAGVCDRHFGQGPDWPCKPLRDLADRLKVTL